MIRLVFPLLVLAVIVGAFLLLRASKVDRRSAADEPREILRRRYAAGEIDEDEYLRRMSGLSQDW